MNLETVLGILEMFFKAIMVVAVIVITAKYVLAPIMMGVERILERLFGRF